MQRFHLLLTSLCLVLASAAFAQNVSHGPVTKVTSGASKNQITEDLIFGSGRTLSGAGTFDFSGGSLILADKQVPWAKVNAPTTVAGAGLTDAATEARVLAGTGDRVNASSLYSDGASGRALRMQPGAAGNIAGLPATFWVRRCGVPTSIAGVTYVFALSGSSTFANPGVATSGLLLYFGGSNSLALSQRGAGTSDARELTYTGFRSDYAGRSVDIVVTFAEGDTTTSPRIYIDGVDKTASFSLSTSGSPPLWMPASLASTYLLTGYNWPAGTIPEVEYGPGAWSEAEVGRAAVTRLAPDWWRAKTGTAASLIGSGHALAFGATDADNSGLSSAFNATLSAVAGARTAGAGAYFARITRDGGNFPAGQRVIASGAARDRVRISGWARKNGAINRLHTRLLHTSSGGEARSNTLEIPLTDEWQRFEGILTATSTYDRIVFGRLGSAGPDPGTGDSIDLDDVVLTLDGAIVRPVIQPGTTTRDAGAHRIPGVLVGLTPLTTDNRGTVHTSLTWSGTHEAKSLVGARALPSDAVIERVTIKPSAASSGSGITVGTTGSATRYVSATTYTTAKRVFVGAALANLTPAGTASNDLDIVVDPDTAAYTGTIDVSVDYIVTGTNP